MHEGCLIRNSTWYKITGGPNYFEEVEFRISPMAFPKKQKSTCLPVSVRSQQGQEVPEDQDQWGWIHMQASLGLADKIYISPQRHPLLGQAQQPNPRADKDTSTP